MFGRVSRPWLTLLLLSLLTSGCSLFSRYEVPDPFAGDFAFGEVVRKIRLEGNKHTRESVIRDVLETRVGEPYTELNQNQDYRRLFQLGVFQLITFATEPVDDGIAVIITMDEISPYLPGLSFNITQENGLEIGPSLSAPNLLGRAMRASVYARFGGATNIGLRLRDILRRDADWYGCCYTFEYFHRDRENKLDEFDEVSDEVFFQWWGNPRGPFFMGPRFTFMALRAKEDSAGNVPPVTLDPDNKDNLPSAGAVVGFDTRNLFTYPTTGWYVELDGSYTWGSAAFWRLNLDTRRYFELSGDAHSLALYNLLTLTSGEVGVDIPIYMDYHIGGTNSVRGWPLGAREGKNQWLWTAEYWWKLLPRSAYKFWFIKWSMGLQLAAFADLGTAWDGSDEFRDNWIAGAGVGARVIIPQNVMIRFDLAFGKLNPEFKLTFHVGGGEKAVAQKQRVR